MKDGRRTPSRRHALLIGAVRRLRLNRRTAADLRESVRRRDARWTPPRPWPLSLRGVRATSSSEQLGWPVWTLTPARRTARPRKVVVAVHGGAYTTEIVQLQWSFYASLVREVGVEVVVPVYPLAPHGAAATVVPLVADLIATLVRDRGQDNVAVEGDSAGAGLAMAAVQELVRRGHDVPARMVLISPWLDLAVSDPRSRQVDDPLLAVDNLVESARLWAGALDLDDPRVSPLNGDLEGLPPTAVYAGSLDILFGDALRLRERARRDDAPFAFDLRAGLLHAWAGFTFLPEAQSVRSRLLRQLLVGVFPRDDADHPRWPHS